MNFSLYVSGLGAMLILAVLTWLLSLRLRDVSIVDSAWSLMFLVAAVVFFSAVGQPGWRQWLILALVLIWALRLRLHLTCRNLGEPEDRRYQKIREKYSPNFGIKSLGIIFIFQAVLAWLVAMPLWPSLSSQAGFSFWDLAGLLLWSTGMIFESVADWQLARFRADHANAGKVMNYGLWHYSRHPNYFGEFLIWWGFYCFAVSNGAWWSIPGPLLISWLLLKFSGVVMLEQDIAERRPAYQEYINTTNAFFPGFPKTHPGGSSQESTR